jgi:hypothetical protein
MANLGVDERFKMERLAYLIRPTKKAGQAAPGINLRLPYTAPMLVMILTPCGAVVVITFTELTFTEAW